MSTSSGFARDQPDVHWYFAYGSNMNPARVARRRMGFVDTRAGVLHGYSLRFNKRSVKQVGMAAANVVEARGAVVEGVLYRLVEPAQIKAMDPFEGYPVRYDRRACEILVADATLRAWVYVANPDHIEEGLRPARWYLDHLLAGRQFLSDDYARVLEDVPCLPDSVIEPE